MTILSDKHLVIVRTSGSIVNLESYNCQELGLAKALRKKGLKVTLILASEKAKQVVIDGVDIVFCSFKAINQQLAWFDDINKILDNLHPTFVQVHDFGLLMTWKVVHWAKKHDVPSFLIQGNYQTTMKPLFKQLEQIYNFTFGRYTIKKVTGIGCKTLMASRYVSRYCHRKTQLTYVGLDVSRFNERIDKDWRCELGLLSKKILLYVGSVENRRNPFFLIDILKALPEKYVLIMVGDGTMLKETYDRIKLLGLQERCLMLGKQNQRLLPALFEASDVFLLASNYEIYGMVILEAMYFGVPVVSSFTAGSETLIRNGFNGFVVNDLNVEKWLECIRSLCENEKLHDTISKNSKEFVRLSFTWDKVADKYLDLYFDAKL